MCPRSSIWYVYTSSIHVRSVHSYPNLDAGHVQRAGRGKKMAEALHFEKVDEDGNPDKRYLGSTASTSRKPQKAKKPRVDTGTTLTLGSSDKDDHDFECPEKSESDSTSDTDSDGVLPSNAEVLHLVNQSLEDTYMLFMQGCRNSPFQNYPLHGTWLS